MRPPPAVEYSDLKHSKLEKDVQNPTIVGRFVLVKNKDHQSFRTAEIIVQVSPGYYFVQFDNMGGHDMPEAEMASVCENAANVCGHSSPAGSDCKSISIGWQPRPS